MRNNVRLLLEGVERRPFSVAGKGVAGKRAEDEGKGLFHEAEVIRTVKFVISAGRPAPVKSNGTTEILLGHRRGFGY